MKRAILGVVLLLPTLACDTPSAHKSDVSFTAASSSNGAGGTGGQVTSGSGGSSGAAGTSGAATSGASSAGASSGTVAGSTGAASTGGAAGSTGSCFPTDTYVGAGQGSLCCTGLATADGYCTDSLSTAGSTGAGSTGGVGTTGGGTTSAGTTTGTVATGTTTGGTCPANMPNINSGAVQNPVACNNSHSSESCPHGFHCDNGYCILNGGSSPLQITLSFDDAEDLDLHVREPKPSGGYCEIYYGNPGPVPQPDGGISLPFDAGFGWPPIFDAGFGFPTPSSCSVGWLDRDSNAGCQSLDGINIENVFYPSNQPAPSGTYSVYLDYWEDCDQIAMSNYAIQVRVNEATYVYCGTVNQSQADNGGAGSGFLITSFTIP